jgi:hypothetical protein
VEKRNTPSAGYGPAQNVCAGRIEDPPQKSARFRYHPPQQRIRSAACLPPRAAHSPSQASRRRRRPVVDGSVQPNRDPPRSRRLVRSLPRRRHLLRLLTHLPPSNPPSLLSPLSQNPTPLAPRRHGFRAARHRPSRQRQGEIASHPSPASFFLDASFTSQLSSTLHSVSAVYRLLSGPV